jgi:[acyl-carrier-protein] S-malonyltransferase
MANSLMDRLGVTAYAFRGYNVTNLGRSAELLAHPAFGPVVEGYLKTAGEICADTVRRKVDLVDRVRRNRETTVATYDEAISLIVAMELAHLRLLEEFFDVRLERARMIYGYSLGELTAVCAAGVFDVEDALRIPLTIAEDCVALAEGVTMGVLFSRGPLLEFDEVRRLCQKINAEGRGMIGISSFLAPNTVLLLGQNGTIDLFAQRMHDVFPARVYLRKNEHSWPPVHTPLVWQRNIPNRVGVMAQTLRGGFTKPHPPVLSLVTGKLSYNDYNSRDLMVQWLDHPQRLWDAVYETLAGGIETLIHVGPSPNLIPATFNRLRDNVQAQLTGNSLNKLGLRAMARAVRRPWLTALLPSRTALLRAPTVRHIILEDWLLEQPLKAPQAPLVAQGEPAGNS